MSATSPSTPVCLDPRDIKDQHDGFTMVDVRTPGEFESVHIPAARNLPLDQLDQHVDTVRAAVDAGEKVVLVCRSGARAHQAQDRLVAAGLPAIPILEGGMLAWEQVDGDVVRDVLRWDMERQLRLVTGMAVFVSVLASLAWRPALLLATAVAVGLLYAAATNTCTLATWMARLPYNRSTTGG